MCQPRQQRLILLTLLSPVAEQYVLTAATYYVIMIEKTAGGTFDGADNLYVGVDTTAPSHDGNTVYYEKWWLA